MSIKWEQIDVDDFLFRDGEYLLRVEQMDKEYWWWAVLYKNEEISSDNPKAKTLPEAKRNAEAIYKESLKIEKAEGDIKLGNIFSSEEVEKIIDNWFEDAENNPSIKEGKINLKEDPLEIQKKLRDEWDDDK